MRADTGDAGGGGRRGGRGDRLVFVRERQD